MAYAATTTPAKNRDPRDRGGEAQPLLMVKGLLKYFPVLGGVLNCGKGQPGQVAPVSHGCPSALFRGVNVLNTAAEGAA